MDFLPPRGASNEMREEREKRAMRTKRDSAAGWESIEERERERELAKERGRGPLRTKFNERKSDLHSTPFSPAPS